MEGKDENMQEQVDCVITDTNATSNENGPNEMLPLEGMSGLLSSNRNGDAISSNEPHPPQLDGLVAENLKKRGRPSSASTGLRYKLNLPFLTLMREKEVKTCEEP